RYSFVADHFQYLACAALIPLLVLLGAKGLRYLGFADLGLVAAGQVVLIVLAMLTLRQCFIYADVVTLWNDTLDKNPDSFLAHNNLGTELHRKGKLEQAKDHYEAALTIHPRYREARFNLGQVLIALNRLDEALDHFTAILEDDPNNADAHLSLGVIF